MSASTTACPLRGGALHRVEDHRARVAALGAPHDVGVRPAIAHSGQLLRRPRPGRCRPRPAAPRLPPPGIRLATLPDGGGLADPVDPDEQPDVDRAVPSPSRRRSAADAGRASVPGKPSIRSRRQHRHQVRLERVDQCVGSVDLAVLDPRLAGPSRSASVAPTPTSARMSASSRSSQVAASILPRTGPHRGTRTGDPGPCPGGSGRWPARRSGLERLGAAIGGAAGPARRARRRRSAPAADPSASHRVASALRPARRRSRRRTPPRPAGPATSAPRPRSRRPTATPPATTTTGMATTTADRRVGRRRDHGERSIAVAYARHGWPAPARRSTTPGRRRPPRTGPIRARWSGAARRRRRRPGVRAAVEGCRRRRTDPGGVRRPEPTATPSRRCRGTLWLTTFDEPPGAMVTP